MIAFASSVAVAKGCIKGAIVGGVACHFAHHTLLGAAAGCVAAHTRPKSAQTRRDSLL
jgi:hypothetical protein